MLNWKGRGPYMQNFFSSPRLFPPMTKGILSVLLWGSLFFALAPGIFQALGWPSPLALFGIHALTITDSSWWQLLTYGWTAPYSGGLSFTFFFTLLVDLFFIGQICSMIERRLGPKSLLFLWLGGLVVGGLCGALYAWMGWPSHEFLLLGNRAGSGALIVTWMMIFSDTPVLFFLAPMRVKWLAIALLALEWLPALERGHFLALSANLGGALLAYVSSLILWNLNSPFRSLWPFEQVLQKFGGMIRRLRQRSSQRHPRTAHAVIIDFRTGKEVQR